MVRKVISSIAACAALAVAAPASALVANLIFPGGNLLSDNSAEKLINADGTMCTPGGDCILNVGDRLVGIFTIETIEETLTGAQNNLAGSGSELTGYFDVTVLGVSGGPGAFVFTFGATNASGVAVQLFEDTTPDYQRIGNTLGAAIGSATDGTLWAEFATSFWSATAATNNIATIGLIPLPGNGGTFNAGLNMVTNNSGLVFATVPCFDPVSGTVVNVTACGSGSLLGTGGANTAFDSFNNVDFTVNRVPAPAGLALLGLGLAGLALRRRFA